MRRAFARTLDIEPAAFGGVGFLPHMRGPRRGVGYTDGDIVWARAALFDSQLRNFDANVDANSIFGKVEWKSWPANTLAEQKRKLDHAAFAEALANLNVDWFGSEPDANGVKLIKGAYQTMKDTLLYVGAAEMAILVTFEARLEGLRKLYRELGYKETIKPVGPPENPDPTDEIKRWAKIAGFVLIGGAVLYVGAIVLPPIVMPLLAAKAAS